MMLTDAVIHAFSLTLLAGMATCLGSALLLFADFKNMRFMATTLAFSAGAMLYVSLVEILPKAAKVMEGRTDMNPQLIAIASFFAGMVLFALLDHLVPQQINPHVAHADQKAPLEHAHRIGHLKRVGWLSMAVISIHNFPEGMVTFFSGLQDPSLGAVIAVAIAVHNIPEGISVSVPVYFATGSRWRAFGTAFLSGIAEPIGAALGYVVLAPYLDGPVLGVVFGLISGMMVALSLDELLPFARSYSKGHETLYGMMAGMMMMAISLLLFTL